MFEKEEAHGVRAMRGKFKYVWAMLPTGKLYHLARLFEDGSVVFMCHTTKEFLPRIENTKTVKIRNWGESRGLSTTCMFCWNRRVEIQREIDGYKRSVLGAYTHGVFEERNFKYIWAKPVNKNLYHVARFLDNHMVHFECGHLKNKARYAGPLNSFGYPTDPVDILHSFDWYRYEHKNRFNWDMTPHYTKTCLACWNRREEIQQRIDGFNGPSKHKEATVARKAKFDEKHFDGDWAAVQVRYYMNNSFGKVHFGQLDYIGHMRRWKVRVPCIGDWYVNHDKDPKQYRFRIVDKTTKSEICVRCLEGGNCGSFKSYIAKHQLIDSHRLPGGIELLEISDEELEELKGTYLAVVTKAYGIDGRFSSKVHLGKIRTTIRHDSTYARIECSGMHYYGRNFRVVKRAPAEAICQKCHSGSRGGMLGVTRYGYNPLGYRSEKETSPIFESIEKASGGDLRQYHLVIINSGSPHSVTSNTRSELVTKLAEDIELAKKLRDGDGVYLFKGEKCGLSLTTKEVVDEINIV